MAKLTSDDLLHLLDLHERLAEAHDLATVQALVRRAARELSGADGVTLVLREGDTVRYVEAASTRNRAR